MIDAVRIYWVMNPLSSRKIMIMMMFIGACISAFIITSKSLYTTSYKFSDIATCCNMFFLVQSMNSSISPTTKETESKNRIVMLQMHNQKSLYISGVITETALFTIAYLVLEYTVMILYMMFYEFHLVPFLICTCATIFTNIFIILFNLARASNHQKLSGIIMVTFIGISSFISLSKPSLLLPDFLMSIKIIPMVLILCGLSFPIANVFGKYCYRTRRDTRFSLYS